MLFTVRYLGDKGVNVKENYSILYISKLLKLAIISIDIYGVPIKTQDYTDVLNVSGLLVLNDAAPIISYYTDGQALQIIADKTNNVIKVYGDQTGTIPRIRTQIVVSLA